MDTAEFVWAVPPDHPAFAGHFPGRPIVPGVVLLDQALLFAAQMRGEAGGPGGAMNMLQIQTRTEMNNRSSSTATPSFRTGHPPPQI